MLRDIYIREPSDSKYNPLSMEINDPLEELLSKIRMLIYTRKGEVLGEPYLGLDLEERLFEFDPDLSAVERDFYTQLAKYVPESNDYNVQISIEQKSDGVTNFGMIEIRINDTPMIGVML